MRNTRPQRIAIIGLPGSGKSTFAVKLGKLLNIPVHHLDKYQFDGKKKRDKAQFLATKEALLKEDTWIIDGCALSTLEMRFACADIVIYFDLPRILCIWRVCKRFFSFNKHFRETGCLDGINWTLIKYIWNFNRDQKQKIEKLSKRYPEVQYLVFHHSQNAEEYLEQVTEKETKMYMLRKKR